MHQTENEFKRRNAKAMCSSVLMSCLWGLECEPQGREVGLYLSRLETLTLSQCKKGFWAKAQGTLAPLVPARAWQVLAEATPPGENRCTHCRNVSIRSMSVISALLRKLLDAKLLIWKEKEPERDLYCYTQTRQIRADCFLRMNALTAAYLLGLSVAPGRSPSYDPELAIREGFFPGGLAFGGL